jgi:branched-chain amino acid transport system permease protein
VIMLYRPSGLWPAPRHEDRPDADIDQPGKSTDVAAA